MLDLIDVLGFILEFILDLALTSRLLFCTVLSVVVVAVIIHLIPNQTVAIMISVPIAIAGIGGGLIWEFNTE